MKVFFKKIYFLLLALFISEISFAQFTPKDINDLYMWLYADSLVTSSGGKVSKWTDITPNLNNLSQNSGGNQPSLLTNTINGKDAISFNGSSSFLNFDTYFLNNLQNFTLIVVIKVNDASKHGGVIGSSTSYSDFEFITINKKGGLRIRNNNTDKTIIEDTIVFYPVPTWNILTISASNTGTNIYKNGKAIVSNNLNAQLPIGFNIKQTMGRYATSAGSFYGNFEIASVIMYTDNLSQQERQDIEDYLRTLYLPSELRPKLNLGADIIKTNLEPVVLQVPNLAYFEKYAWNTGDSTQSITVKSSGTYSVFVLDDRGYEYYDTIKVTKPTIKQKQDTTICAGDSFIWDCGLPGFTYLWSTGQTTQSIQINSAGSYYVKVFDNNMNMLQSDTVHVTIDNYETTADLGPNLTLCEGNEIGLIAGKNETMSYVWSTGERIPKIKPLETGTYTLTATNFNGCVATDNITITIAGVAPFTDYETDKLCFGEKTKFDNKTLTTDGSTIVGITWTINGESLNGDVVHKTFAQPGTFPLRLEVQTSFGCSGIIDTTVTINHIPVPKISPPRACTRGETTIFNSGSVTNGNIDYCIWNIEGEFTSGINTVHVFDTIGTYLINVQTYSNFGCVHDTTVSIDIYESADVQFVYTDPCQNEPMFFFDKTVSSTVNLSVAGNWIIDGSIYPYSKTISKTFTDKNTHEVTLKVKTINGCTYEHTKDIKIEAQPTLENDEIFGCNAQPIILKPNVKSFGSQIDSYTWTIDSIGIIREESPELFFKNNGNYTFSLDVETDKNCKNSATGVIHIQDPPTADFTFNPEFGAEPLLVDFTNKSIGAERYEWFFEDIDTSYEDNPSFIFTQLDTSWAVLYAYSSYNCYDSAAKHIPIDLSQQSLQIIDFYYTKNERDYFEYTVQLANTGNSPIRMVEFITQTGQYPSAAETWEGTLQPGNLLQYTFSSSVKATKAGLPYMCMQANLISPNIYRVYDNDTLCKDFTQKFDVFAIAPNPVIEKANVQYTIPTEGNVKFEIIDQRGQTTSTFTKENVQAGFHIQNISLFGLTAGSYFLKITHNNASVMMPILKVGE